MGQVEGVDQQRPLRRRVPLRHDDLRLERRRLELVHQAADRLRRAREIVAGVAVVAPPGDEADVGKGPGLLASMRRNPALAGQVVGKPDDMASRDTRPETSLGPLRRALRLPDPLLASGRRRPADHDVGNIVIACRSVNTGRSSLRHPGVDLLAEAVRAEAATAGHRHDRRQPGAPALRSGAALEFGAAAGAGLDHGATAASLMIRRC